MLRRGVVDVCGPGRRFLFGRSDWSGSEILRTEAPAHWQVLSLHKACDGKRCVASGFLKAGVMGSAGGAEVPRT